MEMLVIALKTAITELDDNYANLVDDDFCHLATFSTTDKPSY